MAHTQSESITSLSAVAGPVRAHDYNDDEDEDSRQTHVDSDKAALLDDQDDEDNARPGRPRRTSTGSVLQFDFRANTLFLAASSEEAPHSDGLLGRSGSRTRPVSEPIGVTAGIALIVGMQIDSGIFSSPGVVAKETGAVASALLCWVGAGLLSWAGASSFAELGSALPLNGGAQAYLDAAFGPLPAYCFTFTAVTALKPGSQAIISIITGEYLCRLMYHTAFSADPTVAARWVKSKLNSRCVTHNVLAGECLRWQSRLQE